MTVFDTEMHVVTFIFIVLESLMLFYQVVSFINKPSCKNRLYFIVLLFLLVIYNLFGGLFPDPTLSIDIVTQNILAYGAGFAMAGYFPYYFYKGLDLPEMRFHAQWGIWLFLFAPFVLFIVVEYSITKDLDDAVKHAVIIPFVYAIIIVVTMFMAIRKKFMKQHDWISEEYLTYLAVLPWISLPIISYYQLPQIIEVLPTNFGLIIIAIIFVRNDIIQAWEEDRQRAKDADKGYLDTIFLESCKAFQLTQREIEIANLIRDGYKYKDIAASLFISERTVTKHVQNIFSKTSVSSKIDLIKTLEKTE